eukprot:NODE_733_length_2798_cov_9.368776.p1 GENE.NODE_733_length_2798_cov_9.368776~~NODE_733_length_2798_cov_9.368776.p1  ORF type:complete len:912 (+),score=263.65 NODE_733_length_2798_cov_9.368776:63-2798(+)
MQVAGGPGPAFAARAAHCSDAVVDQWEAADVHLQALRAAEHELRRQATTGRFHLHAPLPALNKGDPECGEPETSLQILTQAEDRVRAIAAVQVHLHEGNGHVRQLEVVADRVRSATGQPKVVAALDGGFNTKPAPALNFSSLTIEEVMGRLEAVTNELQEKSMEAKETRARLLAMQERLNQAQENNARMTVNEGIAMPEAEATLLLESLSTTQQSLEDVERLAVAQRTEFMSRIQQDREQMERLEQAHRAVEQMERPDGSQQQLDVCRKELEQLRAGGVADGKAIGELRVEKENLAAQLASATCMVKSVIDAFAETGVIGDDAPNYAQVVRDWHAQLAASKAAVAEMELERMNTAVESATLQREVKQLQDRLQQSEAARNTAIQTLGNTTERLGEHEEEVEHNAKSITRLKGEHAVLMQQYRALESDGEASEAEARLRVDRDAIAHATLLSELEAHKHDEGRLQHEAAALGAEVLAESAQVAAERAKLSELELAQMRFNEQTIAAQQLRAEEQQQLAQVERAADQELIKQLQVRIKNLEAELLAEQEKARLQRQDQSYIREQAENFAVQVGKPEAGLLAEQENENFAVQVGQPVIGTRIIEGIRSPNYLMPSVEVVMVPPAPSLILVEKQETQLGSVVIGVDEPIAIQAKPKVEELVSPVSPPNAGNLKLQIQLRPQPVARPASLVQTLLAARADISSVPSTWEPQTRVGVSTLAPTISSPTLRPAQPLLQKLPIVTTANAPLPKAAGSSAMTRVALTQAMSPRSGSSAMTRVALTQAMSPRSATQTMSAVPALQYTRSQSKLQPLQPLLQSMSAMPEPIMSAERYNASQMSRVLTATAPAYTMRVPSSAPPPPPVATINMTPTVAAASNGAFIQQGNSARINLPPANQPSGLTQVYSPTSGTLPSPMRMM